MGDTRISSVTSLSVVQKAAFCATEFESNSSGS
jgi:hypothetical protein